MGGLSITRILPILCVLTGLLVASSALFIPAKAIVAQVLLERAWTKQLATQTPTPPWQWADFTPTSKLIFPSENKSVLALTDASGESLAFGPTHMAATPPPGERGVTVFAAHRDTHFNFLDQLNTGDVITVQTRSDTNFIYKITHTQIVHKDASGIIPYDSGPSRIALVTCWPLDAQFQGPERLIVWAELVPAS